MKLLQRIFSRPRHWEDNKLPDPPTPRYKLLEACLQYMPKGMFEELCSKLIFWVDEEAFTREITTFIVSHPVNESEKLEEALSRYQEEIKKK